MSLRAGRQEVDSINVPQVVIGFVGAVVLILLTFFGIFTFTKHDSYGQVRREHDVREQPRTGVAPEFGMLHQTLFDTVSDARELRAKQDAQLHSYGWVDKDKQVTHIPIEKAKHLIVENKGALPAPPAQPAPPAPGGQPQ